VVATLVAAPRVGVTTTFVSVVLGQVAAATLIDRFGWLGARQVDLSWERVAALALMAASLVLLLRAD
jgi:transporter family-2 protein